MGDRLIVLAREISKIFEQFLCGTVSEVLEGMKSCSLKGEMVIMIASGDKTERKTEPIEQLVSKIAHEENLPAKAAAKKISEISGISKTEAYSMVLKARNGGH
jgi:16S rRNA (cytidine1402-2'-O)-methyltransferase